MTSTTQSVTSGIPFVVPTRTEAPTAQLVLRNDVGQVVQQWLVRQNKCTLGSSSGCALRCELPGIAPYHALLVVGAKQMFLRALAPKVTRDGEQISEILITDEQPHFELAGHRFEVNRGIQQADITVDDQQKMKFVLARPMELQSRKTRADRPVQREMPAAQDVGAAGSTAIVNMIRAAIEPLECQLQNVLQPLAALQEESQRQRELTEHLSEQQQALTNQEGIEHLIAQRDAEESVRQEAAERFRHQVEEMTLRQASTMEIIGERIADVTQQLSTIERIVLQDTAGSIGNEEVQEVQKVQNETANLVNQQSGAIEQLQQGMVELSNALQSISQERKEEQQSDEQWKQDFQQQIVSLRELFQEWGAKTNERIEELSTQSEASIQQLTQQTEQSLQNVGVNTQDEITRQFSEQIEQQNQRFQESIQAQFAEFRALMDHVAAPQVTEAIGEPECVVQPELPEAAEEPEVSDSGETSNLEEGVEPEVHNSDAAEIENWSTEAEFENPFATEGTVEEVSNESQAVSEPVDDPEIEPAADSSAKVQDAGLPAVDLQSVAGVYEIPTEEYIPSNYANTEPSITNAEEPQSAEPEETAGPVEAEVAESSAADEFSVEGSQQNEFSYIAEPDYVNDSQPWQVNPGEFSEASTPESSSEQFEYQSTEFTSEAWDTDVPEAENHGGDVAAAESSVEESNYFASETWATEEAEFGFRETEAYTPSESKSDAELAEGTAAEQETFEESSASSNPNFDLNANEDGEEEFPGVELGLDSDAAASEQVEPAATGPGSNDESAEAVETTTDFGSLATDPESEFDQLPTFGQDSQVAAVSEFDAEPEIEDSEVGFATEAEVPSADSDFENPAKSEFDAFPAVGSFESPTVESDYQAPPSYEDDEAGAEPAADNALPSWWSEEDSQADESAPSFQSAEAAFEEPEAETPAYDGQSVASGSYSSEPEESYAASFESQLSEPELEADSAPVPGDEETPSLSSFGAVVDEEPEAALSEGETSAEPVDEPAVAPIESPVAELNAPSETPAEDGEDDVEDYMRKLLARMRGVPEEEVATEADQAAPESPSEKTAEPLTVNDFAGHDTETGLGSQELGIATADVEAFRPRVAAPEQTKSLAAMRELANTSARTAIHKSTRQRHLSSMLLKGTIAVIGLIVGIVLLVINGFTLNIGLIATFAAFFVAAIWGYDACSSLGPILHAGLISQEEAEKKAEQAEQQKPQPIQAATLESIAPKPEDVIDA